MTWDNYASAVRMALDTVRGHKMRSFLTVLGVIIGTGTVIAVGSIITGLDSTITNIFRSMGPQTMLVFKFRLGPRFGGLTDEERQRKPISYENARALAERCSACKFISPYLFGPSFFMRGQIDHARYKDNDLWGINLGGTEEAYAANGTVMTSGRFISEVDTRHRLPVSVLGEDIAKSLFGVEDPIGKTIEVDGHPLEVVGTMERPAASFPGEEDRRVLLPYFTMKKMFPNAKENMLVVGAKDGMMSTAMDEVEAILRQERRVPWDKPDTFAISTAEQMVEDFRRLMSITALVMVVLSSIGLLVGGIGVMNIMLVSVTERTKEIGIRKAIGARRGDIVAQFLTEAVVLTGMGGLLGMSLGWLISLGSRAIFPNMPTSVPLWAAVLGVGVSVGVGLFFGIWPAAKAARLDPVVALRYE